MKRRNQKRRDMQVEPGSVTQVFSKQEMADWIAQWLDAFGADRHGVNTHAYMWHVFSFERYPSVSGPEARAEYEQHEAPRYIVLSNDRDAAFATDRKPTRCSLRDWLVFPPNLAWTMAFTHEDGWLGPYFARHAQFDRLNAGNLAQVAKAREVEAARLKGWC